MCRERHRLSRCPKFLAEKTQDRWRIATKVTREIGAWKTNGVNIYLVGRRTTNCFTETRKHANPELAKRRLWRRRLRKMKVFRTAERFWEEQRERRRTCCRSAILQSDDRNQLLVTCLFDSGCQRSLFKKDLTKSLR
ncbi:hypothetical protein T4E_6475 [Trichinella pseudospiralis]|uniref:Uncharacterized protein n=1 Tax=Trichinella pseudospiralis TaxID=6337 RepID=A0A0V0XGK9_TRIPS|nr:hypothetical protein T4E_6475 [Trichinella pseudospiralis]